MRSVKSGFIIYTGYITILYQIGFYKVNGPTKNVFVNLDCPTVEMYKLDKVCCELNKKSMKWIPKAASK